MEALNAILSRRSIRKYDNRELSEEIMEDLIHYGMMAILK